MDWTMDWTTYCLQCNTKYQNECDIVMVYIKGAIEVTKSWYTAKAVIELETIHTLC